MKKPSRAQIVACILLGLTLLLLLGFMLIQQVSKDDPVLDSEALIDRAIRTKNPALCENVTETISPGPDDGPVKVAGQDAVDWCKQQVKAGERIRGG